MTRAPARATIARMGQADSQLGEAALPSTAVVGIVGAGTMGNGIAQAFAVAGIPVTMTDIGAAQLQRGLKAVDGSLERLVKKDKMSAADKAAALARIQTSTSLDALRAADLVIEAAT